MKHKKELFELLETLKELFRTNAETTLLNKSFGEFDLTTKVIFRKEEELYEKHLHPDLEMHKRLHNEFSKTLASFEHQYFTTGDDQSTSYVSITMEFIEAWIKQHNQIDKDTMSYVRISEYINGNQ